ncbi:MAG: DUF89 family protein [Sedimentisphaerales bacterium]|nr:DUF89 family protein [Sedimentisphaerales bacterium]
MARFCLLANSEEYQPDSFDMAEDTAGREHCLTVTDTVYAASLRAAQQRKQKNYPDQAIAAARNAYAELTREYRRRSAAGHSFTIMELDRVYRDVLDEYGIDDPYLEIKQQENERAVKLFAGLVAEHDLLSGEPLIRKLTAGIFAGNLFDLGTVATLNHYQAKGAGFHRQIETLPERPWLIDDYDCWIEFLTQDAVPRRVMYFVDNAGADFVLGCVPLVRYLADCGAKVVLAANDQACFNDMTAQECRDVLAMLAREDESLDKLLDRGSIEVVVTGGNYPQIDFANLSDQCNEAAEDCGLLILEGMGRSLESNLHTRFLCPTLKIAVVKDKWLAGRLGGRLFDLVCRFELAEMSPIN